MGARPARRTVSPRTRARWPEASSALPPEVVARWNHNTHYYSLALRATPCRRALDVGCGDGLLPRLLSPVCDEVVGIDPWDAEARAACAGLANVRVIGSSFFDAALEPGSFDLVASFTAIHHLAFERALARMASLVAPGGRLVVVGIADYGNRLSWAAAGLSKPAHLIASRRRCFYQHAAPIADTSMTWTDVRRTAHRIVPGSRYRRRLYWRYSIEWTRPR